MNILFALEHYYPYIGGVENMFTLLAETLVKQGHKVSVVTSRHNKSLKEHEITNGVSIFRLNLRNRFLFTFFGFWGIYKHAKHVDLIHTTTYNAALPAYIASVFTRKKIILTFHEYWNKLWFKLPYLSFTERIIFWAYEQVVSSLPFKNIIAVSEATKRDLSQKISPKKIDVIYNGIDYNIPQWQKPSSNFTYTFFGRLGVSKGLDIVLQAAKKFSKDHPESCLQFIIPKTPTGLYNKIINTIESNNLQKHIKLYHELGKSELTDILLQSHCIVIPSYNEGFCYAAVEAIAMGIPVISSQRGALAEVVSGTHIKMNNLSAQSLNDALYNAYNENWETAPIKKFTLQDQIRNIIEYYKRFQ